MMSEGEMAGGFRLPYFKGEQMGWTSGINSGLEAEAMLCLVNG